MLARLEWAAANSGLICEVGGERGKEGMRREGREKKVNEALPFRDKSFDTTICLHTLEHVRNLHAAVSELKRVSRKRLIVIVPRQKFFRYTPDYHLNFFGESEQLAYSIGVSSYQCRVIDHCLCYSAKMND